MSRAPPRKVRTWLSLMASLPIALASASRGAQATEPQRLCDEPGCPVAVEIPDNYGTQYKCGSPESLTTGNDVYEIKLGMLPLKINTGKRFKDGVFNIEKVEQKSTYDWTDAGDNGYNYFRQGKVTYTVTCENGIKYRDTYEWNQSQQYDINSEDPKDGVDHFCYQTSNCSGADVHDGVYREVVPISYDEKTRVIAPRAPFSKDLKLPIGRIVEKWVGRPVGLPKYYGGVNKLAVPLILINGVGFDYASMGAIPSDKQGTEAWRKGYASDYVQGSLPDVVSRAYSLSKSVDGINHNGIYFINLGDAQSLIDDRKNQDWLMDRLKEILLDHAGVQGISPSLKVDVVCHSASCNLLRAAIATSNVFNVSGSDEIKPADHIRKIVTLNAPHKGTGLGKEVSQMKGYEEYRGLPELIAQFQDPDKNQEIISGKVKIDFSTLGYDNCSNLEAVGCWMAGQLADATIDLYEFGLERQIDKSIDLESFGFSVHGPFLGPYEADFDWFSTRHIAGAPGFKGKMQMARSAAIQAQKTWDVLASVMPYPRYSDGRYIETIPFFSDEAGAIETGIARQISDGFLGDLCGKDNSTSCQTIEGYLNGVARAKADGILTGALGRSVYTGDALTLRVNPTFINLMSELRQGWLKSSDLVVESKSQKWGLENGYKDPVTQEYVANLHVPATYRLHYAESPEGHPNRPVLHIPVFSQAAKDYPPEYLAALGNGAPLMGRDIFCALDANCLELLSRNRPVLYAGPAVKRLVPLLIQPGTIKAKEIYTQLLQLQEDFNIHPQIISEGIYGVAVQEADGTNKAIVGYDPTLGTWLWQAGPDGGTIQTLFAPDRKVQFNVKRNGEDLTLTIDLQDGGHQSLSLGRASSNTLNLMALGDGLVRTPALMIGEGTPKDLKNQEPPVAWGTLRPILMERGQQEANTSRPWLWVTNKGETTQKNLTLTYYFTADPALSPVVEMDYPTDIQYNKELISGNLWALHIKIPEVQGGQKFPMSGMQIRLHYQGWQAWAKNDDPSLGTVAPVFSEKVVIRDELGRIVWGYPPQGVMVNGIGGSSPSPETPTLPATESPALEAHWGLIRTHENNMICPSLGIKNASATQRLISGYGATVRIKGFPLTEELPILERWYETNNSATLAWDSNHDLVIHWIFSLGLEPGASTLTENQWGLHWADYRTIDKTGLAYEIEVHDAVGKILLEDAKVMR